MRKITVSGVQWYWVVTGGTVFITNKQPGSTPIHLAKTTIGEAASYHCDWCGGSCTAEHNQGAWKITPKHIRAAILNHASTTLQQPARGSKKPAPRPRSLSTDSAGLFHLAASRSSFYKNRDKCDGWIQSNGIIYVRCVFHREYTPSLVLYPKIGMW